MAKVDATVDSKWAGQYKVQGYPAIFFFHKGEKLDFNGQRTKEYLLNWLLKKTRDPLVPVDQAAYEKLSTEDKVSIVFHGDASSELGQLVSKLAVADDFNTYYVAQVGKTEGSVEIIRPFDEVATYEQADQGLESWIRQNERPTVVPFDDRTIGEIFSKAKPGICLFNKDGSNVLLDAFTESAKAVKGSGKQLIFTHIDPTSEHIGPFADYIKIDSTNMPIVLIEGKIKSKFVLVKNPADLTAEDITNFVEQWSNGEAKKYGMTDEVKVEAAAEAEEL